MRRVASAAAILALAGLLGRRRREVSRWSRGRRAGHRERGWIVLAGIHAEAPEAWREGMTFATPASVSNAYAVALVEAALERKALPTF